MTKLAVPAVIIATATYPTPSATPSVSHRRQGSTTVHPVASSRRSQPADASATTEQLLRQRDDLPAGHPDRAKLRTRVIEENLQLAHRLARRYTGRGELLDDLTQVAALALIKAVDGYDPSLRSPFARYAVPSILGALKRHFRDTTWAMRVPRRTQELTRDLAIATGELSQQRGRCPTPAELADHLHVSAADILAAVGASRAYRLTSLNVRSARTGDDLVDLIGGIDPRYAGVDDRVLLRSLRPLFAALPPRERRILTMRFFGGMSQAEIATEVGLSQMHISRLLKQSLTRLRAGLPS